MRLPSMLLASALLLSACAAAPAGPVARTTGALAARAAGYARVVAPGEVPAAIADPARARAQADADAASERRDIDFFALPDAPVGMAVGGGAEPAWVLSFLGTGRTDADLNVELRAFVAGADVGTSFNYSGPTTLGHAFAAPAPTVAPARGRGPTFELLMGLPGNGVTEAYAEFMDALGARLVHQHDARPFAFDDAPVVLAVLEGGRPTGFVFTNQGNRLVLGDRKYADVQSVVCLTAEARVAAASTIVAFNRKTAGPGAAPAWEIERDGRLGTFATCGDR